MNPVKRLRRTILMLGIAYTIFTGIFAWVLRCACGPGCRCSWWCSCEKFWSQWMEAWAIGSLAFVILYVAATRIAAKISATQA